MPEGCAGAVVHRRRNSSDGPPNYSLSPGRSPPRRQRPAKNRPAKTAGPSAGPRSGHPGRIPPSTAGPAAACGGPAAAHGRTSATPREESRQGHGTFGGLRGPSAGGLVSGGRLPGAPGCRRVGKVLPASAGQLSTNNVGFLSWPIGAKSSMARDREAVSRLAVCDLPPAIRVVSHHVERQERTGRYPRRIGMTAKPTLVSKAFQAFMNEAPRHAQVWSAAVQGLSSASALDQKSRGPMLPGGALGAAPGEWNPIPRRVGQERRQRQGKRSSAPCWWGLPAAGHATTACLPVALEAYDAA